jgi:inorganic pyrophosphatase
MVDEEGPDDKLVCVPLRDPMWSEVVEVDDIPTAFRAEIEQFFKVYKDLEGLPTQTAGFGDRGEAFGVLAEARARSAAAERSSHRAHRGTTHANTERTSEN